MVWGGSSPGNGLTVAPCVDTARLLSLDGVNRAYRDAQLESPALNAIHLEIDRGEFVAVMGPSGCGKSTLLNILGLLDAPTSGRYLFDGIDVASLTERRRAEIRKRCIGFIFQSFNLVDEIDVRGNVALGLAYHELLAAERRARVAEALEAVGLSHRADRRPCQLSGGEQQRVAVARALIAEPALILADEPTGNLDTQQGQEIIAMLQKLNAGGATIVMVTHSPEQAEAADRIVTMVDGHILSDHRTGRRAGSDGGILGETAATAQAAQDD